MTRARDFSQNLGNVSAGGGTTNVTLASLQPFLTTSNVVQRGANLYFSNALSFANLQLASINDLFDVVANVKSNNQVLIWNGFNWAPGNVIVTANLALNTTDDLREGTGNLYYTNARARTAFTAGNPSIIIDWVTGTISANLASIAASSNTTDGLPEGFTNKYFSNARVKTFLNVGANLQDLRDVVYPNNDPGLISLGQTIVWNTANGGFFAPGNYSPEVSNFANAAEQANVVLSIGNFTTANLVEFGNLYFTNQRVYANVANIYINTLRDVWIQTNVLTQGSVLAWDGYGNWIPQSAGSLGNVGSSATAQFATRAELANLALFANVAFHALTANIANVALRAVFAETANSVLNSIALAAQVSSLSNFTTDNLTEGSRLYFTNQRVLANVLQMRLDTFADVSTSTANTGQVLQYNGTNWVPGDSITDALKSAFAERANVANLVLTISNFNTDNLQEGANSIYYTTARLTNDIQSAIFAKDITLDDLVVGGDLTVQGNVALFNVANLRSESRLLTLADSAGSAAQAEGSGIYVKGANASLTYSQTNDGFGFNKSLTINGNLIPAISGVYSLGSPTKLWRDLFIGAQTIFMGNTRISENPSGGLAVKDQFGNDAAIQLSNVSAAEFVTVNRLYSNVFPLTELNSYIGGNVKQFTSGTTSNLYLGVMKDGVLSKFAGLRVIETKDGSANVRSDLRFYTDNEATNNSTARLSILGTGNIELNSNLVTINNIRILDNFGNFTGNSFLGTTDVEITHGGTGANTRPDARRNLFSDFSNGIVARVGGATNTLTAISIVQGTGVTVTDGDGQNGNPTIAIGQAVAITDSVQFRNLTLSGNLLVLGNVTSVYSNTLVINDPMIQLGYGNPADAYDLGFIGHYNTGTLERHAGFFRDHTDGLFKVFDNLTSQPGLNDIDTSNVTFRLANVAATTFIGNVLGTVSTLNNFTTDSLREGAANLYFTNARVLAVLSGSALTFGNLSVGNLTVTGSLFARANTYLTLGNTVIGSLVSNAVTLTTETTVTDSITQLNQVLGKLVPARPPAISSTSSIGIQTLSSYRMTSVTQTDRTPSSRTVAAGSTVAVVRRATTYTTNTIANVGLGDNGTVSVIKNGVDAGSRALTTSNDNGVYSDLTIINNVDYSTVTGQASGFWESFRANASGTVSGGWNEVYITHTTGGTTPTAYWYYDATTAAAPQFTNTKIGPTANAYSNSSTVPHFTSSTNFRLQFDVNRLSGDMYPTSDSFITGTSGGALLTPTTLTYALANITTPLAPNLYVASGNTSLTTNALVTTGFGVSAVGCSLTADNSYNTGSGTFTPVGNVLYKTGTASLMEETNLTFTSAVGTGSGLAARIVDPGSTDNPGYTANAFLFNSQTSTLNTYDATIVGSVLKHDQVNYSTGYMPVGPNLSTGRSAAQYFTFRFVRTSVSKFDIQFTGTIAGMWVALPGSTIDSTSTLNGWLDMSSSATTSGIPGANTGTGGNGNNGCAIGGPVTLNSSVTAHRKTCTFGTVSSSSTATNEIYVRIKLTSGQTVSALSLQTASN